MHKESVAHGDTGNMAVGRHMIARGEMAHIFPDFYNPSLEFMADNPWKRLDSVLCPAVKMEVGSADRNAIYLNQDFICLNDWKGLASHLETLILLMFLRWLSSQYPNL